MHLHQTSIHRHNYYSGFHMWVSDVKLSSVSSCTAVTSRMQQSHESVFLKRRFCSVFALCSPVKHLASLNQSHRIKLLLHISRSRSSLLTSTTTEIEWVTRLYGISAVATKQWLMSVAMHVGCWSVTGWIHGNKIMSVNSMQINSTALHRSGLVYARVMCICVMHCCIHLHVDGFGLRMIIILYHIRAARHHITEQMSRAECT